MSTISDCKVDIRRRYFRHSGGKNANNTLPWKELSYIIVGNSERDARIWILRCVLERMKAGCRAADSGTGAGTLDRPHVEFAFYDIKKPRKTGAYVEAFSGHFHTAILDYLQVICRYNLSPVKDKRSITEFQGILLPHGHSWMYCL